MTDQRTGMCALLLRRRRAALAGLIGLALALLPAMAGRAALLAAAPAADPATPAVDAPAGDAPAGGRPRPWRVLPIRLRSQFEAGAIGGGGMQHMQGTARSRSNPDIIYMSQDCSHFWKSFDAGRTWRKTRSADCGVRAGQSIEVDPADPDVVFAVVDNAWNYHAPDLKGLYRSTDGAESWQLVLRAPGKVQRFYQHNIACDATSVRAGRAARWYVAIPDDALYRSDDGGASWTKLADLKGHDPLYAVHAHPADGATVYMASKRGLYVSRDAGRTIGPLGDLPEGEVSSLAVDPATPRRLFAVLKGKGLYRSEDSGATFSLAREHNALWVFMNPAHLRVLYLVGATRESLASQDGGRTWYEMEACPPLDTPGNWRRQFGGPFTGIVPDPRDPKKAVAYNRAWFWRTDDGGRTWTYSSTLFAGFAWGWGNGGVVFDGEDAKRFAFLCYDVGMVFTDNGGDWFERRSVPWQWYDSGRIEWTGMYLGQFQPVPKSQVIVGTAGYYHKNKLIRSENAGRSWAVVDEDNANHTFLGFHPDQSALVFSEDKRSTDAGATWQAIPFLVENDAAILGMCRARPDTLYATNRRANAVYRSDDRGATWRLYVRVGWTFRGLSSMQTFAADPRDSDVVYALGADRDLARYDGRRWTSLGVLRLTASDHRNYVQNVAFDGRHPEVMYATTRNPGVSFIFRSRDGGAHWEDVTLNLPLDGAGGLVVSPHSGEVLRGGTGGTWVLPPPYAGPTPIYDEASDPVPGRRRRGGIP